MKNEARRARLKALRKLHTCSEQMVMLVEGVSKGMNILPPSHKDIKAYRYAVAVWREHSDEILEAWKDAEKRTTLAINKLAEITDDTKPKELE